MAAVTAAVVGAVAAVGGVAAQGKAAREQKRASRVAQRRAELQNAKSRRRSVAEAQAARAQTVAQGANQGVSGGSSVQGAAGSVLTQGASAISSINQNEGFDRAIFNFNNKANNALQIGATFQAIGSVANSFGTISDLAKPKPPTGTGQ